MTCLPFLVPLHPAPIPSLPSEFLALLLGCVVLFATALRRNASPLPLPAIAFAPLMLALLVLVQYALGMFAYGASALLPGVFLLWAALLACAGRDAAGDDASRLCDVLAGWMLAGALANAMAGLLQWGGVWQALGSLIAAPSPDPREGVYGNLAQQNHFASHIAMGLAALAWLWQSRVPPRRTIAALAALAAALLLFALALSGSRSGWLYLALLGAAMLSRSCAAQRRRNAWLLLAVVILLAGVALAASLGLLGHQLARLTRLGDPFGPRAFFWSHAWQMGLAHPWLGAGWDNFAATMIGQLRPGEKVWGIDQYPHNLLLQLLATGGWPAVLALLVPLVLHVRQSAGAPMLAWTVLAILGVHSMLEQPLYYSYFLGPAAFLAGAMARSAMAFSLPLRHALAVVAAILLFGLVRGVRNYGEIREQVYEAQMPPSPQLVQRLHNGSVFGPLLELALPGEFVPADAPVAQRLAFNDKVRHFAPIAEVEFRHAVLLAEAGEQAQAQAQLVRAARAYPAETPAYLAAVAALGDQAQFNELARAARRLQAGLE
jgi:O-antigen ligase